MNTALYALDLAGVAFFAASGGLKASQKRMDLFGFVLMGTVTGIGGGTLRDLVLGVRPVFWVTNNDYLAVCAATSVAVFFIAGRLTRIESWLVWADAVGLATFCVGGASVALAAGTSVAVAVLMGVMTACFGGILRDVLCAEIPLILHREIYATAAAAGALVYALLDRWGGGAPLAIAAGFAVAMVARSAGILWRLSLPSYRTGKD